MKTRVRSSKPHRDAEAARIFGENMRRARRAKGITGFMLAGLLGDAFDKGRICKYERGFYEPSVSVARRIADALNVSLDDLLPAGVLALDRYAVTAPEHDDDDLGFEISDEVAETYGVKIRKRGRT